jgi:hypothetical protein
MIRVRPISSEGSAAQHADDHGIFVPPRRLSQYTSEDISSVSLLLALD